MSIKDDLAQKMYAHIRPAIEDITGETQRRHDRRNANALNLPSWRCTNCLLFSPTNRTYCHYCYELAPTSHNVAPAATTFAKAATVADTKD